MHNAKMAAKDKEIEDLKFHLLEVQRQYEEIYGTKLEDLQEVKVYSGIIMPEIQRMTRHTEKVEKERRKSQARGLSSSSSSDDDKKKKTKVVKDNNNPEIQETFRFPHSPASRQPLLFQVYDWDRFSKNDLMGEVMVPLGQADPADRGVRWA